MTKYKRILELVIGYENETLLMNLNLIANYEDLRHEIAYVSQTPVCWHSKPYKH